MNQSTVSGASIFGNSALGANNGAAGTPDKIKEKRFYNWHEKQGINPPQDYTSYAAHPAPFSASQSAAQSFAASQYLQKMAMNQAAPIEGGQPDGGFADVPEASRRKPPMKRSTSQNSPPLPSGSWPKSMFGSKPANRARSRHSATPDFNIDQASSEGNLPPLASVYDDLPFDAATMDSKSAFPESMTPTQVRVSGFSEDRFPDVVRGLRRYYGQILEPYSGLPESECKFVDPDIFPQEQLANKALKQMIQPCTGTDEYGNWIRITFRDRAAAEKAVAGSAKGEFVIGGRRLSITMWNTDPVVVAEFGEQMDIDIQAPGPNGSRRNSTSSGRRNSTSNGRRNSTSMSGIRTLSTGPVASPQPQAGNNNGQFSQYIPGAKVLAPKQVAFQKQEGWLSGWTNSIAGGGKNNQQQQQQQGAGGWGSSLVGGYRYVMDEVVGFKYL